MRFLGYCAHSHTAGAEYEWELERKDPEFGALLRKAALSRYFDSGDKCTVIVRIEVEDLTEEICIINSDIPGEHESDNASEQFQRDLFA